MSTENEVQPMIVFSGSSWEANLVKNLLENAEIQAFLRDEYIGTIAPWQVTAGGGGAVKVIVSSADLEEAQEVIENFRQNQDQ